MKTKVNMNTPNTPTETHRELVREMALQGQYLNRSIEHYAQLLADSEARAVACFAHELETELARAERAEAECLEQARLLGMSASREASLLGKISRLEHQLEKIIFDSL